MQAARGIAIVAVLAVAATPASATIFATIAQGTLVQATVSGPPRLNGVPFEGRNIVLSVLVDDNAPPTPLAAPGGRGEAARFIGAVIGLQIDIAGFDPIVQTSDSLRSLFLLNNAGAGAPPTFPLNIDQISLFEGVTFASGVTLPHLTTPSGLDTDVFVSGFSFGRSAVVAAPGEPGLLSTAASLPDMTTVWNSPAPFFFSIDLRQGRPASASEFNALPLARFNAAAPFAVTVALPDAVPTPAPLLLFGLGAAALLAARTRRAA